VLWVAGIDRPIGAPPRSGEDVLFLTVVND
jgi:hypothetical protein